MITPFKNWPQAKALLLRSPWLKRLLFFLGGMSVTCLAIFLVYYGWNTRFNGRALPNLALNDEFVGGMTREQVTEVVRRQVNGYRGYWPLVFAWGEKRFTVPFEPQAITFDEAQTVEQVLRYGRERNLITRVRQLASHFNEPQSLSILVTIDENWVASVAATIAEAVDQQPIEPEIRLEQKPTKRVITQSGQDGYQLDTAELARVITESISTLTAPPFDLTVATIPPKTSAEALEKTRMRAEQLLGKQVTLTTTRNNAPLEWTLTDVELIGFITFEGSYKQELLTTYLTGVGEAVAQNPENAKFNFDQSLGRVIEFVPAKKGLVVDIPATSHALIEGLKTLEQSSSVPPIALVVKETDPEITLENSNTLGIKTLLGRGYSTYKGSILSRVHNVSLAAKRINGTLVKPGGTFSFNEAVGEISQTTGYQAAYVIRNGRTELGDGGGVCQDSTTVFRAALDAGLPITERRAHSYRVGYYEQNAKPGLDATVFSPTTDLKFLNDTPGHILIQTIVDEPNRALTVEIYGTDDGRESEISNHTQWDSTPPPPDVFVDDPTLPTGTVKQVDWKAWGLKTKFDYSVRRNGALIYEKTFYSTYKPWAAVFLRGVGQ